MTQATSLLREADALFSSFETSFRRKISRAAAVPPVAQARSSSNHSFSCMEVKSK